jgi:hypothetical protein
MCGPIPATAALPLRNREAGFIPSPAPPGSKLAYTPCMLRAALPLLVCTVLTTTGLAWGPQGHMTVAYIAFQRLTPASRTKVAELLRAHPSFATWAAEVPGATEDEKTLRAFLRAANWPDVIKSGCSVADSQPGTSGNVPLPNDPRTSQNIGFTDTLCHKYWHFHDKPFSSDHTPTEDAPTPSALTQFPVLTGGLKSGATAGIRSYDLAWIIHLAGDMHQPLHATQRFTANQKHGDAGANGVRLGAHLSLHSFWDQILGSSEDPEDAASSGNSLIAEFPHAAGEEKLDIAIWVDESFRAAKRFAYAAPIKPDGSVSTTSQTYRISAHKLAEKQVVLAGYRLARVINAALQ